MKHAALVALLFAGVIGFVANAQAADLLPDDMVVLHPAAGITLSLPKGWIACDEAANAQLAPATDPMNFRALVCPVTLPGITFRLRAFNPALLKMIVVSVIADDGFQVTEDGLRQVARTTDPDLLKKICDVEANIIGAGNTMESCVVSPATLDAHDGVLTTLIGVVKGIAVSRFRLRIYEFASTHGYVSVQFNTPVSMAADTDPLIDAIMKTIVIE